MLTFCGEEETAIAVNVIANGTVECHAGFLPHYMMPKATIYNGVIMQITEMYDKFSNSVARHKKFHHNLDFCVAAVISHLKLNKSPWQWYL